MEFKGVSIRNVDQELWKDFRRLSRRAGYERVGDLLNDLILCLLTEFSERPWELRIMLQKDCKISFKKT